MDRRKTTLFWTLLVLLNFGALELTSRLTFALFSPGDVPFESVAERRREVLANSSGPPLEGRQVRRGGWTFEDSILHPFLGFAREPKPEDLATFGFEVRREAPSLEAIAGSEEAPQSNRAPVVIGITGGSVAESLFYFLADEEEWWRGLHELPGADERPVELILLGLRGYKQPQQSLAVGYYLSLGGPLDVLINLDGFNEIGLAARIYENGVFPAYPYHWRALTEIQLTPAQLEAAGRVAWLGDQRRWLARWAERARFSATAGVFWWWLDRHLGSRQAGLRQTLHSDDQEGRSFPFFRVGPRQTLDGPDVPYAWMADLWFRGSVQLSWLAEGDGFRYLHALQPNQYMAGSKPMSTAEQATAISEESPFRLHVPRGYPELIARGRRLQQEHGVEFLDLTQVFATTQAGVYRDDCCHLNRTGNRILMQTLLEALGDP